MDISLLDEWAVNNLSILYNSLEYKEREWKDAIWDKRSDDVQFFLMQIVAIQNAIDISKKVIEEVLNK